MISVLIPISSLYRAIDTLKSIRLHSVDVETIVRIKDNDIETLSRIEEMPLTRYIIGPDNGVNVHEDINELCLHAKGEIMFPMNEHTDIFTPGWDLIKTDEYSIVHLGQMGVCPGLTRKVYNILGHYALHPDYISYISNVGQIANINKTTNTRISTVHTTVQGEYGFKGRGIETLIHLDANRIKKEMGDE
jgi:hypothetical protein